MQLTDLARTESLLEQLTRPVGITLSVALALLIVRHYLLDWLKTMASRRTGQVGTVMVESLRTPTVLWCAAVGLMAGLDASSLPRRLVGWGMSVVASMVILSISIVLTKVLDTVLQLLGQRMQIETPVTGLGTALTRALIFTLGGLLILDSLGLSITPLVAALGVGGLTVSLALQDTLSNLFAGVHILAEKPVRVGDYIRLETGQEGYVSDIGWRSTRIRMLSNNMVIVPNVKLAQTIITNFSLPERRMSLGVPISVSFASDPDRVEKILMEEATQAAGEVPGLLADPPPSVRFIPGFGESALNFTLNCQVREFVDQYLAQHELLKRIFRRLRLERIEIPLPQRVVHIRDGDRPVATRQTQE